MEQTEESGGHWEGNEWGGTAHRADAPEASAEWTSEPPKADGWYWWLFPSAGPWDFGHEPTAVQVDVSGGPPQWVIPGTEDGGMVEIGDYPDSLWLGPIPEPPLPPK